MRMALSLSIVFTIMKGKYQMNKPVYMRYKNLDRENQLMPLILKALRQLGGKANKREIIERLAESSEELAEYISYVKTSAKSGREYRPFMYNFNFAVKHLATSGFLEYELRKDAVLTAKGLNVDLSTFDSVEQVRAITDPLEQQAREDNGHGGSDREVAINTEEEIEVDAWRKRLLQALHAMAPAKFEVFTRQLVRHTGIIIDEIKGMSYVGDGGIDGYGYAVSKDLRTTRVAIQAKRWQGSVGAPEIDKFRGAMDKFRADYGIFVTTSRFTQEAVRAAREGTRVITLIDGEKICDLVAQYEVYVTPRITYDLDDFFFEK